MYNKLTKLVLAVCLIVVTVSCGTNEGDSELKINIIMSESAVTAVRYQPVTITATVLNSAEGVLWSVDNSNIEIVTSGNTAKLTGLKAGEYTITSALGELKAYCVLTVTELPQTPFAVDVEIGRLGELDSDALSYDAAALLQGRTVLGAALYSAGEPLKDIGGNYNADTNRLIISESELEAIGLGEYEVAFDTNDGKKAFTLTIASLIIDSYDKFTSTDYGMPSYWTNERINTNPLKDGYFILARDIDFSGKPSFAINTNTDGASGMPAGPYEYENSWFGTFDGRGNAVKNIVVHQFGIFAHIGKGAVVKNFGIINGSVLVLSGNMGYLLAHGNDGIIDNCYAELVSFPPVTESAIFCRQVRFDGKVTNSIASVKTADISGSAASHAAIYHHSGGYSSYVTNTYILRRGADNKAIRSYGSGQQGVWGAFEYVSDLINAVNRRYYNQFEGLWKERASFDGFDKRYWTINDNNNNEIYFGLHRIFDAEQ